MRISVLFLLIGSTLIMSSCLNQPAKQTTNEQNSLAVAPYPIPSNWKYYACPQKDYCDGINFPFPVNPNGPLEVQQGNVIGSYLNNDAYFTISETSNKFSLEESAQCMDSVAYSNNCNRKILFLKNLSNYSVLKFTTINIKKDPFGASLVVYLIKSSHHEFFVRAFYKTSEGEKALDQTMLNLKSVD